jgi:hypothetical protein
MSLQILHNKGVARRFVQDKELGDDLREIFLSRAAPEIDCATKAGNYLQTGCDMRQGTTAPTVGD